MTNAFKPKYVADDILGLYTARSQDDDEGRIRSLAKQFRQLCRLEHEVKIPDQYKAISKQIRTPFVRDSWHRITSSLVRKPPVEHITPKDDDKQIYRDAANLAERWGMAMWERQSKQLGSDLVYTLTAHLVRDGESVLKVVHRPDAWANFPEGKTKEEQDSWKRGIDLPFAMRAVDRLNVVYEDGEWGDGWVIEYGEYAKPYLKARYGMADMGNSLIDPRNVLEGKPMPEGLQASSTGRTVKVEFFDVDEWHVIIDGQEAPGFPKPNPYSPYLPYFRAPAFEMESLLYSLLFLAPRLDEVLTMKLNWGVLGAYPNPVLETIPNSSGLPALEAPFGDAGQVAGSDAAQKPIVWSPGKFIDLPLGKRLSFLVPPPVGKDLNDLALLLKSLVDIAGIPSIMRGLGGSGDSGYLANQMLAAAEMAYKLAALSCQRQMEKATEFCHWMVENVVQQTVYVLGWEAINPKTGKPKVKANQSWLGLSPETSSKNIAAVSLLGPVSFQYRPTLPTDEQARAMIALQLTNSAKPLYSRRDALERLMQEEDPDSIIEEIYVEEQIDRDPTLNQMVVEAALEKAGMKRRPEPATPNPAAALVGPNGQPLLPQGPNTLGPVPLANQMVSGTPAIPGLTVPLSPTPPGAPQGIPAAPGGRAPGSYPGLPSNQGP